MHTRIAARKSAAVLVLTLAAACSYSASQYRASRAPPAPTSPPPSVARAVEEGVEPQSPHFNTERYSHIEDNAFLAVEHNPLSTFSADVDTASYANVRRFIHSRTLPPPDAVRIEELVNYFPYEYRAPTNGPFGADVEVAPAPWRPEHLLARVGMKAREPDGGRRPPMNLVFLLDVSGSMSDDNKLPLLKKAMKMLVEQLGEGDRVAIAVYAGAAGLVLPSTSCDEKEDILDALDDLSAGGSTNGGAGIRLAYDVAAANFKPGGVNRVILATDGDFNVGVTSEGDLVRLIQEKAAGGVFLTVLGFGMGNYNDSLLEKIADKGNGSYAYIDTEPEARKVFVEQLGATLVTVAKDVKFQVEFNPSRVAAWRLVGYENRLLRAEDFKDDRKDAGEVGAGHTVTALFELVPAGLPASAGDVEPLRYQRPRELSPAAASRDLFTVRVRYKAPDGDRSSELSFPVIDSVATPNQEFRFAAAVAAYGMLLRNSPHKGGATFALVRELAESARGRDPHGYRRDFVDLVERTEKLARKAARSREEGSRLAGGARAW